MKSWMNGLLVMSAGLCLMGCPEETTDTIEVKGKGKSSSAPSASASSSNAPAASASTTPDSNKPSIAPRAKAELHEKDPDPDHSGSSLGAKDAKSAFIVPAAWKSSSADDINKAVPDDGKARFAATGYGDGDDTGKKADAVAKALELTDCSWGSDEEISLGKDKVATQVADGVCMRGKTVERAIRAVVTGDDAKIVAIGAWNDKGGDDKAVFNSFRSLAEGKSVVACCSALQGNLANAPPNQKLVYGAAIVVCQGLTQSKDGLAALAQIRKAMPGVPIPAKCQ